MKLDIWKAVPGTQGNYEVSIRGNVRSTDRMVHHKSSGFLKLKGKLLRKTIGIGGYYYVTICLDAQRKKRYVHELVCETFYTRRPEGCQIDHIDKNRLNNNLENLVYKSVFDNCSMPGTKHPNSLLTDNDVKAIRAKYLPRKYTLKMLGEEYGVDPSCISLIIRRINWKHI